jgi:hypothetical protein
VFAETLQVYYAHILENGNDGCQLCEELSDLGVDYVQKKGEFSLAVSVDEARYLALVERTERKIGGEIG